MKTDTDVLDIYRHVFDDEPEADAVARVIATLRGASDAADVDTAVAILKADDFCGDDAQLRQDAEAIREAFAQVSDAERVRDAYRSALVDIARHVASPGAEDLADKLDVEDLPTLVECVTGRYTPKAGAEAEDLRRCMERYTDGPIADEMRAILDEVDARDSLAYLTEQDKPRIDVIGQLRERVAELEAALDDGISIVMDFAPGCDVWLDNAERLLENTIEAADAAKGRG